MSSRTDPADHPTPTEDPTPEVSITLLHGVGLAPSLYDELADELARTRDGTPAPVVHAAVRRGYDGSSGPAASFDELLADVATIADRAAPTLVVGVSGGATLALAAALSATPGVVGVVVHEPLVGPLATELHAVVSASAAALDATPAPAAAVSFVERLVGAHTWTRLPAEARAFAGRHVDAIRAEVPVFLAFAPSSAELAGCAVPIVVTTGSSSTPARHAAAAVLERLAGATTHTIDGAGHLAPWERPSTFAAIVRAALARTSDPAPEPMAGPAPDARSGRTA